MSTINYRIGDEAMLDEIRELWETLNQHHGHVSEALNSSIKIFL